MSLQKFRSSPVPDFDEAVDPDYEQAADVSYDEAPQVGYDEARDPDYDTDFADPDSEEASQEWYLRKQK